MELSLDVSAEIATKNDLNSAVDRINRRAKSYPRKIVRQNTADATGTVVLNFGSPSRGMLWTLTVVTMVGSDDHTSIAGTAAVYDEPGGGLPGLVVPGATVPNMTTFSNGDIVLYPNDVLMVIGTGMVANTTQLTVICRVLEYTDVVAGIQVGKIGI